MKLRFEIDQALCFRKGIDAPNSIVVIEVNPADISVEDRNLIADRLVGIDVLSMGQRVKAESPDYGGLIAALHKLNSKTYVEHETNT